MTASEETPMGPWREIPGWFYDQMPLPRGAVEHGGMLRVYADIQAYFGKPVSKRAVNEFLFGDSVKDVRVIKIQSPGPPEKNLRGELVLEAEVRLPGGTGGEIKHTFIRQEQRTNFDLLKPEKINEKFPRGFGRELFRQYIPALRELGIRRIDIQASSSPSEGMNGGHTWCFYGFTNSDMHGTLQKYILYLEDYYGIVLDGRRRNDIMKIGRMRLFGTAHHAEHFLLGKRIGSMTWSGFIPDIHNESSIEMNELIRYLQGGK
jgi:hypothetical protein